MEIQDTPEDNVPEQKPLSSDAHRKARKELVRIFGDEAPLKWDDSLIEEAKRKQDIDRLKYPELFDDDDSDTQDSVETRNE